MFLHQILLQLGPRRSGPSVHLQYRHSALNCFSLARNRSATEEPWDYVVHAMQQLVPFTIISPEQSRAEQSAGRADAQQVLVD